MKKEVLFYKYCKYCEYFEKGGNPPCDACLSVPSRENSSRPLKFKKKERHKRPFRTKNMLYNRNK